MQMMNLKAAFFNVIVIHLMQTFDLIEIVA